MDANKVQELSTLLSKAMGSVVIKWGSSNERMDIGTYKKNMQKCWDFYSPDGNFYFYMLNYKPEILDEKVREQLLDVVRNELAQYIHVDKIQTAAISIVGGIFSGFPLDHLLEQLLKVAIVRGEQHAAQAFYKCVDGSHASFQEIGLLNGVRVEQELQVSKGIDLVPLPKSTSDLPPYFSHMGHLSATDLLGRTLIFVDHYISPIFLNPLRMRDLQSGDLSFQRQVVSAEYPNFDLGEFCEALSLASDTSIQYVAVWRHLNDDKIFNTGFGRDQGIYIPSLLHKMHTSRSVTVSETDIHKAMSLYRFRKNLRPRFATKLKVSIDRWIKSKANLNKVDIFIDLGIALESLCLEDMPDSGEFRFRLSLRAAWYLGKDREKRQSLIRDFKKIYDLRSSAVHTGEVKSKVATLEFTQRAQDLCRQSIVNAIKNGQLPEWNLLVLGDDSNRC